MRLSTDQILKNPITSTVGFALIGLAIFIAFDEGMKESVQLLLITLLGGAGAVALGLKDRDDGDGHARNDNYEELQ